MVSTFLRHEMKAEKITQKMEIDSNQEEKAPFSGSHRDNRFDAKDGALKRSGTEFNMVKMVSLVRERTMDSQDFYRRLTCLPMRIRQMTFINEESGANREKMNIGIHQKRISDAFSVKDDSVSHDIAMQVDSWMRKRTAPNSHHYAVKSISSSSVDSSRRRRQKRHRLREADDNTDTGSTTGVESIISGSTEKSVSSKYSHPDKKFLSGSNFPKNEFKYLYNKQPDDLQSLKIGGTYGNAYNEIEFQKRYRRIFDLQKHLHFVSTTCLSGQKIVRKGNSLPPMSGKKDIDKDFADDLLAISSVKRSNEPTTLQENNDEFKISKGHSLEVSPWIVSGKRTNIEKYDKLPQIAGSPQRGRSCDLKKSGTGSSNDLDGFKDIVVSSKTLPRQKNNENNCQENEDINFRKKVSEEIDPRLKDRCNNSSQISGASNKTNGTSGRINGASGKPNYLSEDTGKCAIDDDADKESDITEYDPTPGMKISIHIKYKNDQSLEKLKETGQMKVHVKHRLDGRIHGDPHVLITESELKHVSE